MHFSTKIKKFFEGMRVYENLKEDEKIIHVPFALNFTLTIVTIVEQLQQFLVDVKNKVCREIPDIDFELMTDIDKIMSKKLKTDMAALNDRTVRQILDEIFGELLDKTPLELYNYIHTNTITMTELLKKIYPELKHADMSLFEDYVRRHIREGVWDHITIGYQKWKDSSTDLSLDSFLDKQEQVLKEYLEKGIMCFVKTPSNNRMDEVDYTFHRGHLDCNFKDTMEYKMMYAQFMYFATRRNGMLIIDYKKYGKYLFENFYRFNEEQKVAVFELCFYLSLIQDDMRIFPIALPLASNHSLKTEVVSLPEVLATPEAMVLWNKAYEAGYIDEYYQPKCSRPEAALLAFEMASRLNIEDKWKAFEKLWERRNMSRDYSTALEQRKSLAFRDDIRKLFG